jgi:hypothetical protein
MTALVAAALCLQDDGKDLWDFKPGTQWTYDQKEGEAQKKSVMTVKEKKDGKVYLESKEYAKDAAEPEKTESLFMVAKDGFIVWGQVMEGQEKDMFRVFKAGAKKGDKWTSPMFDSGVDVEIEHKGEEKIKVAGKEYDAIHCFFKVGDDPAAGGAADFFLVRGVGMVRFEMKLGALGSFGLELKEFKAAK